MHHSAIIVDGEVYEYTVDGLIVHCKGSAAAVKSFLSVVAVAQFQSSESRKLNLFCLCQRELERRDWPQSWAYTSRTSLSSFQTWVDEQNKFM